MIRPARFRYGRVKDVVMRRLESGASPPEKRNTKDCRLPIADCRLGSVGSVLKLAISNWQLAMTR